MPPALPDLLASRIRQAITAPVVALLNDRTRGERPVTRRPDGLFGPNSVAWRVHGDVTGMMVGGITGLLLQMLHPAVLAGVWDHSSFRTDMLGRLRRTARFIAVTTYASREDAEALIARVRQIHWGVRGTLPDGRSYSADDPSLLAWVHVTEATSFLDAWIRYADPSMAPRDQDRYFAEMAVIAEGLGAAPIPRTRAEARALIQATRPQLLCDGRTREVARLLLNQPAPHRLAEPVQSLTMAAAVDLLPEWARQMHGLRDPAPGSLLIRPGMRAVAGTLRWAFSRPASQTPGRSVTSPALQRG
ncbi:oxygenase MpaB family protein [Muricoccus radiodurans]|uniref:oxygenase MpaB family protein n=1 Tax=Muricoccus radiodurans TaxID=2231721 RepID=UPI003CEFDD02